MDNDVINLAKAIRQTESGGNFGAKGKSGESGAYQWTPDTWKAHAQEALGNANADMSPSNQNAVAYTVIKKWKDQGLNPAQIAAKWNSGSETGWENKIGVNKMGVEYNVPKYVKSVTEAYQGIKQGRQVSMDPNNPSSTGFQAGAQFKTEPAVSTTPTPEQNQEPSFIKDISNTITESGNKITGAVDRGISGEINPFSALIQAGGGLASGATGLVGDILHHTPVVGSIVKGAENVIGGAVQGALNTDIGQSGVQAAQNFAQTNPEAAGNIGAVADIAMAVPVFKGLSAAKTAIASGIERGLYGSAEKQAANQLLEATGRTIKGNQIIENSAARGLNPIEVLIKDKTMPLVVEENGVLKYKAAEAYSQQGKIINKFDKQLTALLKDAEKTGNGGVLSKQWMKEQIIKLIEEKEAGNPDLKAMLKSVEQDFKNYSHSFPKDDILLSNVNRMKRKAGNKYDLPSYHNSARDYQRQVFMRAIEDSAERHGIKNVRKLNSEMAVRLEAQKLLKHISNKKAKKRMGLVERASKKHPVVSGLVKTGINAAATGAGLGGAMVLFGKDK